MLTTGRAHSRRPIGCGIFSRARGERLRRRLAAGRRGVGFVPHVPGRGGRGAWREGGGKGPRLDAVLLVGVMVVAGHAVHGVAV